MFCKSLLPTCEFPKFHESSIKRRVPFSYFVEIHYNRIMNYLNSFRVNGRIGIQKLSIIFTILISFVRLSFRKSHLPDWQNRPIYDVAQYAQNEIAPSRKSLWNGIVSSFGDVEFNSVLEVGSGYGANLLVGNSLYPNLLFTGVDYSKASIQFGNANLLKLGIDNISLIEGDVSSLPFEDNAFDLTFSDALFLYIDSNSFEVALTECLRVTSKYLVFIEFQSPFRMKYSFKIADGWIHNFTQSLKRNPRVKNVSVQVFESLERSGRWKTFGKIIFVHLHH